MDLSNSLLNYKFELVDGLPAQNITEYGIHIADTAGFPPVIGENARVLARQLRTHAEEKAEQGVRNSQIQARRAIIAKLLALKFTTLPLAGINSYLKDLYSQYSHVDMPPLSSTASSSNSTISSIISNAAVSVSQQDAIVAVRNHVMALPNLKPSSFQASPATVLSSCRLKSAVMGLQGESSSQENKTEELPVNPFASGFTLSGFENSGFPEV